MLGSPDNPGNMVFTLRELFRRTEALRAAGAEVASRLSYVEVSR